MSKPQRQPITTVRSTCVVLPVDDIDTDQIIPARFLTTTERTGLGPHAFHDWRYFSDGSLNPDFPLNGPAAREARILVAGRNFGCGSSREHAVWSLMDAGIQAVVSSAFADIFRGNALGNGLLPVQLDERVVATLIGGGGATITIDLAAQEVTLPDETVAHFAVPRFAKHCLMHGLDELGFLLEAADDIDRFEREGAVDAS
jgi:3-isopropylmalate/(R)-2-methylmalate dehydratase small subunit